MYEPWPFMIDMYSEKNNGPGLKYELTMCIKTGHIVRINGPFPVGAHNDGTVFKNTLTHLLCDEEVVEVDIEYCGNNKDDTSRNGC